MAKKISEISELIWSEQLSDAERETNSKHVLTRRLNQLLVSIGDLTECVLGKVETVQGESHGISGEYREYEDGKKYWQPLYNDVGYRYVLNLFQRNRISILNPPARPPAPADLNTQYRYSRADRNVLLDQYGQAFQVVLLEGPNSYWVYNEDAVFLGNLLGASVVPTAQGCNLTYKKSLHDAIIDKLKQARTAFMVVFPTKEEVFIPQNEPVNQGAAIGIGSRFIVRYETGEIEKYTIPFPGKAYNDTTVITLDGTTEIIQVKKDSINGFTVVTEETPFAGAAIGKHVGQSFECNGEIYTVIEIV